MTQAMFPGFVVEADKESPAPRVKVLLSIDIYDRATGEKLTKKIPGEFFRGEDSITWLTQAISHPKTRADIATFTQGRDNA